MKSSPWRGKLLAALAVLAGGSLAAPAAALAALAITISPADPTANNTPAFAGTGALPDAAVTVALAPVGGGANPPDLSATAGPTGDWSAAVAAGLADGTYTATATDGTSSAAVQFTVDTKAPTLTVTGPAASTASSTPALTGGAGSAAGDLGTVNVELRAGFGGAGALLLSQGVTRGGAAWTAAPPALAPGQYSVRAAQQDAAGNAAQTAWRNFTVVAADFTVSPDPPETGKPATFTATPAGQSYAWELTGDGSFTDGTAAQVTATYPDTTPRVVGVRVTAADGTSSVATRTITPVDHTAPGVTVTRPGSLTASGSPVIGGAAGNAIGDGLQVAFELRRFVNGTGDPVQSGAVNRIGATWAFTVTGPLAPGVYSVRASQTDISGNTTTTPWRNFTIVAADFTIAPEVVQVGGTVTLTALAAGVRYAWDLDGVGGFNDGTNRQVSRVVTSPAPQRVQLRITAPDGTTGVAVRLITPGNQAPIADFAISPAAPAAGEAVRLTSTSSDPDGLPLASEAWDLNGDGQFDEATGGAVSITFPAAGTYRIGLRIIDQAGTSREVTKFVAVSPPRPPPPPPTGSSPAGAIPAAIRAPVTPARRPLLSPFPVVRIVAEVTPRGLRLRLLSVVTPKGAVVRARCAGKGCPHKKPRALRARTTRRLRIRALEGRELKAGTVVQIFVTARGRIGKYTRFVVRGGKAPKRDDRCLATNGRSPIRCPVG
jgi:hypothetical protein